MARQMKESGVSWIGQVPDAWDVVRTKNCYTNNKQVVGEKADDYERLALTLNGVIKRPKDDTTGLQPEAFNGYQILRENELVFKLIDLANVATSRVGYSPYEGIVSPAYIILHPNNTDESKFGEYYFLSMWQREIFNHMGDDGVRSSLNASDLLNVPYLLFQSDEKKRIVKFLDEKCAEIDAVIAKTSATIEEYKKIKQSIISEAVTKGIRGDRPMKDSGIEWIGDIPTEWENRKMLSVLAMRVIDGPHESPDLYDDGVPYVSANAIENGRINFDKKRGYISEEYCDQCDKRYRPQRDDILVIKLGATTGQVAIVDTDERFNIWVPLAAVRCNHLALPKFVYYAMQSNYYIRQMEMSWTYGTQQTLGVKTIERLRIVLPSFEEQQEIADYLDKKCAEIDALIEKKTALLAEMEVYKKSVIYEYITGKKEV